MRAYLALFRSNMRLTARDRGVLFFNYLFPLIFFFAFAEMFHAGTGQGIAYFVGTVLTMGIMGNGLWGAGMRSVQDREANILRRFKVTPISPLPILAASMASGLLLYLPVIALIAGLAHIIYGMPMPRHWISLVLMASLGVCAFRALGLILAAVTNTMAEANILIQVLYMPMLFLSGTTIPSSILPAWAQTVGEFMPATYLVTGFQGIFFRNQNLFSNAAAVGALVLTTAMGLFLAVKLFRWEKEEKLAPRNKLWVAGVLAPFLIMGCWRSYTKEHIGENASIMRDLQRSGAFLIKNTRVFLGDGTVKENASVLVHDGKIVDIYDGDIPDTGRLRPDIVEGSGKTLLPGLIDVHVHLSSPGGMSAPDGDFDVDKSMARDDAALLYSGVTAARSTGDGLDSSLKLRGRIANGSKLGAQLFICGPMFTTEGGHGTEFVQYVPKMMQDQVKAQLVRVPQTAAEARQQVDELKQRGVDGIKAILESGFGAGMLYNRMDVAVFQAVAAEARARNLPLAVHTGDPRDVTDAVDAGASSIEHGSWRGPIPGDVLAKMAHDGIYLDPTLGVAEAYAQYFAGKSDALDNSLVEQTVSANVLKATRDFVLGGKAADPAKAAIFDKAFEQARENLLRAWKAGVPLVMGTDSGNPLVFPGPSMHHELKLWVAAGIPPAVALQAATGNAAALVRAANHIGGIRKGMDADLLLVDGNPLQDIGATERISLVVFKGERLNRPDLFDQK
ncbi:MAG TPA: amidohydrolase family protein [Bryobacteraceae bacterium]|nr:amidohydrolase family protein [Bryobacteraceae bacterium]